MSVEVGQLRKGAVFTYAVMWPHPRRKGWWVLADTGTAPRLASMSRRAVEAMDVIEGDVEKHEGWRRYRAIVESSTREPRSWA